MRNLAPQTEKDVAEAVLDARASGTPLEIVSAGSKRALGRAVEAQALLDVSALTGILKYEPEELVISARAATPVAGIEAALAERHQMLGFEPADWGPVLGSAPCRATLAGIVAANASGPRRVKAGAVRDHLIGCRFVNGQGEIIAAGGKVVKNVTGFDIPKLMCGAFGTLGVLTELTFRVVPLPRRTATLTLLGLSPADGLAALRLAARLPLEASGLAYVPPGLMRSGVFADGLALIRVEGSAAALDEKLRHLREAFVRHAIEEMNDEVTGKIFRGLGNGEPFLGHRTDIWRLSVPASDAAAVVVKAGADLWYADCAGSALWLGLPATADIADRLRRITLWHGGHAELFRASVEARATVPVFEPEAPARAGLTARVKAAFDPLHLFNRGRMFEGL